MGHQQSSFVVEIAAARYGKFQVRRWIFLLNMELDIFWFFGRIF
jgi:hypothetical protein